MRLRVENFLSELVLERVEVSHGGDLLKLHLAGSRRYSTGAKEAFDALLTPKDAKALVDRLRRRTEGELTMTSPAPPESAGANYLEAFALYRRTIAGPAAELARRAGLEQGYYKLFFLGRRTSGDKRAEVFEGLAEDDGLDAIARDLEREAEAAGDAS